MPARPNGRLDYLDGVRGWAALSVVIFHATWELFGRYLPQVRVRYASLLNDGTLAVYIFFVLSGLVLTYSYLLTGQAHRIQRMALARYPRLVVPIAGASLIGFVLLKTGAMANHEAAQVVNREDWLDIFYTQSPSIASLVRFSLYDVFFKYDVRVSYDSFLWTMPIELYGSFLLFSLLGISGGSRRARFFYYAVLLIYGWKVQPFLLTFAYGFMLAEFMTSSVYGRLSVGWPADALGIGLFATACLGSVILRSSYDIHECGILALLVVSGTAVSPALRRFFQLPLSRWLGHLSFPLYLVHSFVICSFASAAILWLHAHDWSPASTVILVTAPTIALSLLAAQLFTPVERIAIRVSHWFADMVLSGPNQHQAARRGVSRGQPRPELPTSGA